MARDTWYKDDEARKTEEAISSTILLATAGGPSSHSTDDRDKNRGIQPDDAMVPVRALVFVINPSNPL